MIEIIIGDITKPEQFDVQYIAHQCNCTSARSAGLAKLIFDKWPLSNTYYGKNTNDKRIPGTIDVFNFKNIGIINMYSQCYPGKVYLSNPNGLPSYLAFRIKPNYETEEVRIEWFKECLARISLILNIKSVAFPYGIGCGLAGGDWKIYNELLETFAEALPKIKVVLVKKDAIN